MPLHCSTHLSLGHNWNVPRTMLLYLIPLIHLSWDYLCVRGFFGRHEMGPGNKSGGFGLLISLSYLLFTYSTVIHSLSLCGHENQLHLYDSLCLWPKAMQLNKCLFLTLCVPSIFRTTLHRLMAADPNLFYTMYLLFLKRNVCFKCSGMMSLFIYS